jgi:hypothetical protein
MAIGVFDHLKLMRAIEILGSKVALQLRKAVAGPAPGRATAGTP